MGTRPAKMFRWLTVRARGALVPVVLQAAAASAAQAAATVPAPIAAAPDVASTPDWAENAARFSGPGRSELYLDVVVNGMARGLNPFGWRDGELWATAATLRQLGLVLGADAGDVVRLAALPDVQSVYDTPRQRLTINASLAALRLPTTVLDAPGIAGQQSNGSNGVLLNYDLYALQASRGTANLNAWSEVRAFGAAGVVSNTVWTQLAHRDDGAWAGKSTRLDTTWSRSFPDPMLTLRIGDTLTSSSPWTRATRIAGVQLATNFALQPYRVTVPTPSVVGSASLPSDVELYVNGLRQYTGKVPAGPFQLNAMPSVNGAGTGQVIVTDMLGRTTTLSFALYAAHQLLKEGLSDWSADLGVVRTNYGLRSFDYGHEPVASGTWRHGISSSFTFEAHGEATRGLVNAGVGGALLMATAGVVSASTARSLNDGRSGAQLGVGYSWRDDRFNVAFDAGRTHGAYADVAARYGGAPVLGKGSATAGYDTRGFGTIGLSYVYLSSPGQPPSRFAGASWFKAVGRTASMNVSASQDLVDRSARSIYFSMTIALDGNTALSAGVQHDDRGTAYTLDANRSMSSEGGIGWRAGLRRGASQDGGIAEVEYAGRYGRTAAGISVVGANRYAYESASGALVLMAGSAFATRRIDDAFAVASTDGIADVPVTIENRLIGTTDARGMLLVTPLRAYENNQLGIDALKLPADMRIERVAAVATPTDRAGVLVRFGITPVRAASIVLVDAAERPLPLGSLVRLLGRTGDPTALVGFDGAVYLDQLEARNVLDVQTRDGRCRASFDYHKPVEGIGQIGPLTCREIRP